MKKEKIEKRINDGLMQKATKEQILFGWFCRFMRKKKQWKRAIVADLAGLPVELIDYLELDLLYPEEFNAGVCKSIEEAFGISCKHFIELYPHLVESLFEKEINV